MKLNVNIKEGFIEELLWKRLEAVQEERTSARVEGAQSQASDSKC